MTDQKAKAEAEKIRSKFYSINCINEPIKGANPCISREYARQCAIIHVKGIIEVLHTPSLKLTFWQSILTELERT